MSSIYSGYWKTSKTMNDADNGIDWSVTTWDGSRRAQLRQWRSLSLRERFEALDGMADLVRQFEAMRREGKFRTPGGSQK